MIDIVLSRSTNRKESGSYLAKKRIHKTGKNMG